MSADPAPETEAVFTNVVNSTVRTAKQSLCDFSDITWEDDEGGTIDNPQDDWNVNTQKPADSIGSTIPTDTAITLMINPPRMR